MLAGYFRRTVGSEGLWRIGCHLFWSQGDITDVGASDTLSLSRMDDAAAGRLPVSAARSGHHPSKLSLEAVEMPRTVAAKDDQAQVIDQVALERRVARRTVATPPAISWVGDADILEEGDCDDVKIQSRQSGRDLSTWLSQ